MWSTLEKISEQVTKYSTFLGQLWYILVFLFRLIVVATVGGAVYSDEQSSFKCSQQIAGCENICYNEFAKISHIRFWAFQLLAVTTPTVFFHFYSMYVSGEIEKLKSSENQLRSLEEGDGGRLTLAGNSLSDKDLLKFSKRVKSVGQIKVRRIYSGNELKEVPYTNKIHYAYYLSIVFRLGLEGLFIYLGYLLFYNMDPLCLEDSDCDDRSNIFYFLWMEVPAMYHCRGEEGSSVRRICSMHFTDSAVFNGHVPCVVSRPYEKTVFLRYMTVLSAICFVICVLELVDLSLRKLWKTRQPTQRKKRFFQNPQESVFYASPPATAPTKYYEDNNFYPSLGVPVRMANNLKGGNIQELEVKNRRKIDEDKDSASVSASVKSYV